MSEDLRRDMTAYFVAGIDEVLAMALQPAAPAQPPEKTRESALTM